MPPYGNITADERWQSLACRCSDWTLVLETLSMFDANNNTLCGPSPAPGCTYPVNVDSNITVRETQRNVGPTYNKVNVDYDLYKLGADCNSWIFINTFGLLCVARMLSRRSRPLE